MLSRNYALATKIQVAEWIAAVNSGQWAEPSNTVAGFRDHLPGAAFPRFSQAQSAGDIFSTRLASARHREEPRPACFVAEMATANCTKSGHPPVDGVHSIENKSDKGAHFLLTPELEGVQQNRSLTLS